MRDLSEDQLIKNTNCVAGMQRMYLRAKSMSRWEYGYRWKARKEDAKKYREYLKSNKK